MTASNHQSVVDQITAHGIRIRDGLRFDQYVRCFTELDKEKRGWYRLYKVLNKRQEEVIIGAYGIWVGNEPNPIKITFQKDEFTKEEKAVFAKLIADDQKRNLLAEKPKTEQAANTAKYYFDKYFQLEGDCDYLAKKHIKGHGVKYSNVDSMAIPLCDNTGRVMGLQIILDSVKKADRIKKIKHNKEYFPVGMAKKGAYHLIGMPTGILLIAEGYATGATLYEATGIATVIAFDAHNINPVIEAVKKRFKNDKILIAADADTYQKCADCKETVNVDTHPIDCPHCEKPHKKQNAGVKAAQLAALQHACAWIAPTFADEPARLEYYNKNKGKLTDFNDLFAIEGTSSVLLQVEQAIKANGWTFSKPRAASATQGAGEKPKASVINCTEALLERYAIIQNSGVLLFDKLFRERCLLNDMKQLCTHTDIPKRWQEHPHRHVVERDHVGFDPTGTNEAIKASGCNTYGGFEMQPVQGKCNLLLELLEYMGAKEANRAEIFTWMQRWLAYPLQHPGAKLSSSVVVFGPQGAGKNMFFNVILKIYGKYGCIIGQTLLEDKHNDFMSSRLFIQANEIGSGQEKWHVKDMLKPLITDPVIRINPKNIASYEERNFANFVFMSNNSVPLVLDQDDRRYIVLETPIPSGPDFYAEVIKEVENGGAEALYHYLLTLDLGNFKPDTKPPMTVAKANLIQLCESPGTRFYEAWTNGELTNVEPVPCLSTDLYKLFTVWCRKTGNKPSPMHHCIEEIRRIKGVEKLRKNCPIGSSAKKQMVIYPHNGPKLPPGQSDQSWLWQHIEDFRREALAYE